MVGIYFSGTGNTRYCIKKFVKEIDSSAQTFVIEDINAVNAIKNNEEIVLAYPIYFSNLPKIVRDFINNNKEIFSGKKMYIIATMGLFSGDGTGCSARLLKKFGAKIIGGLHIKMPDCIGDEKLLKKSLEQNKEIVQRANMKILDAVEKYKSGLPTKDGLNLLYHLAGLFGQRLWFFGKTKKYYDKINIDQEKCVRCGKCTELCPMKNLQLTFGKVYQNSKCVMCYRCFANCPKQAITILGDKVYEQCNIEKYL